MIEKIKKALFAKFGPEETKGLFFSGFTAEKKLLFSQGFATSDAALADSIEALYTNHAAPYAKKTRYIVCDIVGDITAYTDTPDAFLQLSPEEYGFIAIDTQDDISGVLLPNTSGVADAKSALFDLKNKYGIHGQVELYAFRTTRIIIAR